ncbi:MAG: caspase family protein [Rhodospirillales bacterium]|nr:caspase family protein [Rhodospirillales bacterium]
MRGRNFLIIAALLGALAPVSQALAGEFDVAVVIGNRQYQGDRIPEVAFAHRDAEAFKTYLVDVLDYDPENIVDLRDATQAQMEAALGNARSHQGTVWRFLEPGESTVTVFYSGHGVPGLKDKRGYLLPVNADPNAPEINGYPVDVLYENLRKLEARAVRVYLDACFSGESSGGQLLEAASGIVIKARMPKVSKGMTVLTAAANDQVASWDKKARHGLFTTHLLDALYGKADGEKFGNGDGAVSLDEVGKYLKRTMTRSARRTYGRIQTASLQGEGAAVLAVLPKDKTAERSKEAAAPQVATLPPVSEVTVMDETLVAQRNANVRSAASVKGAKLTTLPAGTDVSVTGKTETSGAMWYRVALADGKTGFVFGKLLAEKPVAPPKPKADTGDMALWLSVKDGGLADLESYLEKYPEGLFAALAQFTVDTLKAEQKKTETQQAALPNVDAEAKEIANAVPDTLIQDIVADAVSAAYATTYEADDSYAPYFRGINLTTVVDLQVKAGDSEGARRTANDAIRDANSLADKPDHRKIILQSAARGLAQAGDSDGAMRVATGLSSETRASVMADIAVAKFEAGDAEGARRLLANAIAVANSVVKNDKRAAALYGTLTAQFKIEGVEESLRLANRITDRDYRSWAFVHIASQQAEGGDIDAALHTLGRAEEKFRSNNLANIARLQAKAGDMEGARRNMDDAIRFTRNKSDDYFGGAFELAAIATNQAKMGDIAGARATMNIASSIVSSLEETRREPARARLAGVQVWVGVVEGAFNMAYSLSDEDYRNSALSHIAVAQAESGAVEESRRTVNLIQKNDTRHGALTSIARHLLDEKRKAQKARKPN